MRLKNSVKSPLLQLGIIGENAYNIIFVASHARGRGFESLYLHLRQKRVFALAEARFFCVKQAQGVQ